MAPLNGTDSEIAHTHIITDFKMTGSPAKNGMTTYNGTATVIMMY